MVERPFGTLPEIEQLLGPNSFQFAGIVKNSAMKGIPDACCLMGLIYHRGMGRERDEARALWFLRSVRTAEATALINEITAVHSHYVDGCVHEAAKEYEEAGALYWEGAHAKSRECITQLAKMMLRLAAERREDGRAERLLILARKMGDRRAAYALGKYYKRFHPEKAEAEFRLAAERGHVGGRFRLSERLSLPK
jgi:TPR repeat protein